MITDVFDGYVKDYRELRTNVIDKFFGSRLTVTPPLNRIKTFIDEQGLLNNYFDNFFGVTIPSTVKITYQEIIKRLNEISAIKKTVDDLKLEDLQKICQ